MKVGVIAPLSGEYNYFGTPIHNGAVLALGEAKAEGDDLEILIRDDGGVPERTRVCLEELADSGVVAVLGPVESHSAAIGSAFAREREVPVITPSATASYLTAEPNPWFFRAISPDRDRTDTLARWARLDVAGAPILVVHEVTPPDEVGTHPPLYGESAGRDFIEALNRDLTVPYPVECVTFERRDVLSRTLKQECARLVRDGTVAAAAILAPTASIIEIGTFLRQQRSDLPLYVISPGRDLFARSTLRDGVKAVTDTVVEDADDDDVAAFREHYAASFPLDTEDPVAQYATFAYDAGRVLVAALRRKSVLDRAAGPIDELRNAVRRALRKSPPRSDLLMSTGHFVLNNDLFFKPNRRVLDNGVWTKVRADELRVTADALAAEVVAHLVPPTPAVRAQGFDAFLSYRHGDPDEQFTRALRKRLIDAGLTVALDRYDFFPACTFLEEMERCVKESRYTLLVVSSRYFESRNTQEEAIIAQVLAMDDRQPRLIPLTLEAVDLPLWLHAVVGIDFSGTDAELDPYERLVAALRDTRERS